MGTDMKSTHGNPDENKQNKIKQKEAKPNKYATQETNNSSFSAGITQLQGQKVTGSSDMKHLPTSKPRDAIFL